MMEDPTVTNEALRRMLRRAVSHEGGNAGRPSRHDNPLPVSEDRR
jgi:hypothetical protein